MFYYCFRGHIWALLTFNGIALKMAELQRWIEDLNLSNPDGDDEIRDGETQGLLKAVPSTYINKKQQDIKTADEWFTWIKPFITIPILRKAAGGVSTFSADSVGISVSSRHADDSAALSMAIAKASDHLNQILRDGAGKLWQLDSRLRNNAHC